MKLNESKKKKKKKKKNLKKACWHLRTHLYIYHGWTRCVIAHLRAISEVKPLAARTCKCAFVGLHNVNGSEIAQHKAASVRPSVK